MKKLFLILIMFCICVFSFAQMRTYLKKTDQQFQNKEFVWSVYVEGNGVSKLVGEWWPIHGMNLVTQTTDPQVFENQMFLEDLVDSLKAVASAPDGMTKGYTGHYQMQGKSLSNGIPCGDDVVYNYGIVVVDNTGYNISFTHNLEITDYDTFYNEHKEKEATVFFLPSIYRNGKYLNSSARLDKVLVRRETPNGKIQIGVVIFAGLVGYNTAREIVLAWDRPGKSKTTHIYMLDGGDSWGQSVKQVNGIPVTVGSRIVGKITNYLVFY